MVDYSGGMWMVMTVLGVIVLGAALAYAMTRNRGMTRGQKQVSEDATRQLYKDEQKDPSNRGAV